MKKCFSPRLARERRDRRSQLATAHHAVQERERGMAMPPCQAAKDRPSYCKQRLVHWLNAEERQMK